MNGLFGGAHTRQSGGGFQWSVLEEVEAAIEIRAATAGFNLQLDPASMDQNEAETARQVLRKALARLEHTHDD